MKTDASQYNPKNPDAFEQTVLPDDKPVELNIVALAPGLSVLKEGDFQSKNFKPTRSGYRFREDGTFEALSGELGGLITRNLKLYRETTAGEDLTANDIVYPSGNDIVERVRPTSFASSSATFTEPGSSVKKILRIDDTRTLHINGGARAFSATLEAYIGTVNAGETDLTYGSAYTFNTANAAYFHVCEYDTNKFLVIYEKTNITTGLNAVVLDCGTSGNTITNGTIKVIDTDMIDTAQVSCAALDTGRVAITYYDGTDAKVQILSISGSTITLNTPVQLHASGSQTRIDMVKLDADKLIAVYAGDADDPLVAKIITVSGTVPTVNASNTINATSYQYTLGIKKLSSTKVALVYNSYDGAGNAFSKAGILTISGSTITVGTFLQLATVQMTDYYINVIALSSSVLMTATYESSTSIKYHLLFVDGTTITSITTVSVSVGAVSYSSTWVCKFKPFKFLGAIGPTYTYVTLGANTNKLIGVVNEDILDNNLGLISVRYTINENFSGLTAGSIYYIDDSGRATTESSSLSVVLGIAISDTSMLIQ